MKPELILHADMLDILFENRNKEYGAYELRRQYDNRLIKSLTFIFLILIASVSFSFIKNYFFPHTTKPLDRIIEVPIAKLENVVCVKPDIILKQIQKTQKAFAQTNNSTPIITRLAIKDTLPTQKDLDEKIISNQNIAGENLKPNDAIVVNTTSPQGTGTQPQQPEAEENKIYEIAEYMPEFPGGLPALQRFLSRNLKTPKDDMEACSKIKVLVKFVVDKDGSITGIDVEQSGGNVFDEEVIRVMKKMPAWKPASQNGRHVAVYFKIPVVFQSGE